MKHLEEVIINYDKKLMEANAEIERLHSIIKEVREYIEERYHIKGTMTYDSPIYHKDLLEILDKENN